MESRGVEPRSLEFQSSAYTKSAKIPSVSAVVAPAALILFTRPLQLQVEQVLRWASQGRFQGK